MKGRRLSLAGHMVSSMMHEFGFLFSKGSVSKPGRLIYLIKKDQGIGTVNWPS